MSAMISKMENAIAGRGYRVFKEEDEGITYLAGDKGRFGVIGSFITHLSFIIITLGAIYGGFSGYEGFINAPEGQTFSITNNVQWSTDNKPSANDEFQVRVNRFWIDYATDGSVKDYYSNLTVLDQGQEVKTKTIQVNDPLIYKGVKFYQSSYGDSNGTPYTGLSVRKDPGVNYVWLGCGLMVLGITIAYILQHRKIWVVIKEANGVAIAEIGAITDKNKLALEADFEAIIDAVNE
jgi:cytochrome c biogenesis protein ResB